MNKYDSIQYMNVYSREYAFSYTEIGEIFQDFLGICKQNKLKLAGNIFYAINSMDKDANMNVEFFYPAKSAKKAVEGGLKFQTYFVVDHMLSVVVMNNFEENMEKAYASLMEIAEQNNLNRISPFYNEIFHNGKEPYCIVKVVVEKRRKLNEDNE